MQIDGYIRVSKVGKRGGDTFISPDVQREAIERWAATHKARVRFVEELDESGARVDRPKLLEAIARVEAGESAGLVVAKLDRFFRSQMHGLQAIERIAEAGGFFASADGDVDTRDDRSRLMLGIRLAIAEDERERRRQSFETGVARAVERGIHRCPVAPFGYRKREDKRLEPDPELGAVVTELFERRAGGEPIADLCRWMNSRGIVTAYGGEWTLRAVKALCRNRVYLGEARNGQHVKAEAHEALTDELTFHRAAQPGRINPPRSKERPALLSSLIRCAGCRHGMQSFVQARGGRCYRCHRDYPAGRCPEPAYISVSSGIEDWIVERFFEQVGRLHATPQATSLELAAAERELRQAEGALVTFRDDPRIIEALGADAFAAGLTKRKADVDAALEQLVAVRERSAPELAIEPVELRETWPSLSVQEQRRLLSVAIDCVFIRRGRTKHGALDDFVWVCWRGDAPELPRKGRRPAGLLAPFRFPVDGPGGPGVALAEDPGELPGDSVAPLAA